MIMADPLASAVASPVASTATMVSAVLDHTISTSGSSFPPASCTSAVNCTVSSSAVSSAEAGETVTMAGSPATALAKIVAVVCRVGVATWTAWVPASNPRVHATAARP